MRAAAKGEVGRLLASAELLKRGVCTAQPDTDIGFDLVTISGSKILKVQVKTSSQLPEGKKYRFPVRSRPGSAYRSKARQYTSEEVDVFVFVSLHGDRIWVVPRSEIKSGSYWFMASLNSPWVGAWHVLM